MIQDQPPTCVVSVSVAAGPGAPAEARALVDSLPVILDPRTRTDLRLALSELVATRVVNGYAVGDHLDVQMVERDGMIHCEVGAFEHHPPTSPGRSGLQLVDRIATRWGTQQHGQGVWFELENAPRAREPSPPGEARTA
jgi:hypothetical protein